MLTTLTLLVAMTTAAVAMELPITRHFSSGFQCDFCYTMPTAVQGWTAHVLFDHPVDTIEVYKAIVERVLQGGQDFVITNKDYNGNLEAGEDLCLKFTARTTNPDLPKVYFYVEGVENPMDILGVTHPMPATTVDPDLATARALWTLGNFDEDHPLDPFHKQSGGYFNEGSMSVVDDPAGRPGKVLRVYYQKGHYVNVHSHRGLQFYGRPTAAATSMTLSYDIYFSPGFDFVKGGKLPGLFGGATICSGGSHSDACFSTRLMWRSHGDGEVYAYIPVHQDSGLCHQANNHCNPDYGNSLGRGSWRFKAGQWQNIAQHVTLNTPGQLNGKVKVWFNGQLVLDMHNLNIRTQADVLIEGIYFSTFFGGSDSSWAPTADCYTYYKNFVITDDPAQPATIG